LLRFRSANPSHVIVMDETGAELRTLTTEDEWQIIRDLLCTYSLRDDSLTLACYVPKALTVPAARGRPCCSIASLVA
jgi:hypothetical protein